MKEMQMRIHAFRKEMKDQSIDFWIVPTNDFHGSEYIGEHFKVREYLTGFTGSTGTAVIGIEEAWLWVDGRYFIQAELELKGSGILLYKSGESKVPDLYEFLEDKILPGQTVGADGRVISVSEGKKLKSLLSKKNAFLRADKDIAEKVWENRPPVSKSPVWFISSDDAGESRPSKLKRVRQKMKEKGADAHLITALDDIAWMYNMRGNDIACSPVAQAYSLITMDDAVLFLQEGVLDHRQRSELSEDGIVVKDYRDISRSLSVLRPCTLLMDEEKVNYRLYCCLSEGVKMVEERNPSVFMKAIKNGREAEHIRCAHQRDGTAMTRLIYWLKNRNDEVPITETEVADRLESFRKEQEDYLGPSFETICAYAENAAMCHYVAKKHADKTIRSEGFLLIDAGGQYKYGTTDISRTIALGPLTEEERFHYTLVLKGMIRLSKARFRYGVTGRQLDVIARGPLWEHGLDFNHGVGHGVGCFLNVHEAPNFIHWKLPDPLCTVFEEGMLTSDEPGYYEEGKYGIRLENLLLCRAEKREDSRTSFLFFESVSLCPIDLDPVDLCLLEKSEKIWLNDYHENVYREIGRSLPQKEREWLYRVTRPVLL